MPGMVGAVVPEKGTVDRCVYHAAQRHPCIPGGKASKRLAFAEGGAWIRVLPAGVEYVRIP